MGVDCVPLSIQLENLRWSRLLWNGFSALTGQFGGFQYSERCLNLLESQIPESFWKNHILTFNQHFPRAASVLERGGSLEHYIDAPFSALATGRGLKLDLPKRIVDRAMRLERENYAASKRVITMGRWAAEAVVQEFAIEESKVRVILPGANLMIPEGWVAPEFKGRAGIDRPFTLGFVGKDWQRKGLLLLSEIQGELTRRGWSCRVLAAGNAPRDVQLKDGLEFVGYIDKARNTEGFLGFLAKCDVGCLFSSREALGISTLEFLRAGIPVAGFAHEGPADTLPPDAGFRFALGTSFVEIADRLEAYLRNEGEQMAFLQNAREWSKRVTWERCIREFQELWNTGTIANPVQPWKGLEASDFSSTQRS
ncbi:MAG: glycosyltransferase family 4 protein [Pirellula sp.]